MASPFSGSNIRRLLRIQYSPFIGFFVCFILALFIQLLGFGIGIVIAGIIAGFMIKRTWRAILTTFLAGFVAWLALFGYMYLLYPDAARSAWITLSTLVPAPQIFISLIGGVISGVGGQLGSLFADIAYGRPLDPLADLPPGPERVPTEELPRRKRVKGKKPKRKKKKRKY